MAHKLRLFFFFFALSSSIFATEKVSVANTSTPNKAENLEGSSGKSSTLITNEIGNSDLSTSSIIDEIENLDASGTSITSDKLEVSFNSDQTELSFTGNVKVNSPEFSVECAAAKIITFGHSMNLPVGSNALLESIKQISITGPLNLQYGDRSCSADHAEITTTDSMIILSGNATAKDIMGTVSGSEIRINYKIKSVEISSASPSKPVRVNVPSTPTNSSDGKNISPETTVLPNPKNYIENIPSTPPISNELPESKNKTIAPKA